MDLDAAHIVVASKVPMLKPGEFELWRMRLEQYIQMMDYALWDVIENENSTQKHKQSIMLRLSYLLQLQMKNYKEGMRELILPMELILIALRRFLKNTKMKLNLTGNDSVAFDKTKVECYNCHKRGHFARECRAPRGHYNRSRDVTRKTTPVETPNSSALVSRDGLGGYDWSDQAKEGPTNYALMVYSTPSASSSDSEVSTSYKEGLKSVEQRLEFSKTNESKYIEQINVLKVDIHYRDRALTELQRRLDLAETEKVGIQLNVNKLENASKSLNKIIECQIVDNYKKGQEYNAVSPPHTGLFPPLKSDLSSTGLEELINEPKTKKSKDKSNKVEPESVRIIVMFQSLRIGCQMMKKKRKHVSQAAPTVNAARPFNVVHPKRTMNVNTAKPKAAVNAAKAKAKYNAVKGKRGNAVMASACWIMRKLIEDMLPLEEILKEGRLQAKNSVLFTDTECIVLSPDFKLIDEYQILLRVPRQNNMYNIDLKNIVYIGDLTCLFAKATVTPPKICIAAEYCPGALLHNTTAYDT
nr:ribonuclease H-like domain-containing protein [Tanacetum cinerariifolium]